MTALPNYKKLPDYKMLEQESLNRESQAFLRQGEEVTPSFAEGDIHSSERGTCARANSGKPALALVPFHLLAGCARVLMHGEKKYARWNWSKGGKWSTAMSALLRHLFRWWLFCEELDPESGQHHLDHAMCNLLFLMHYRDTYREGDDRPPADVTHFAESLPEFNRLFAEDVAPATSNQQVTEQASSDCRYKKITLPNGMEATLDGKSIVVTGGEGIQVSEFLDAVCKILADPTEHSK